MNLRVSLLVSATLIATMGHAQPFRLQATYDNTGVNDVGNGVVRLSEGAFVIVGETPPAALALRVDASGTILWRRVLAVNDLVRP